MSNDRTAPVAARLRQVRRDLFDDDLGRAAAALGIGAREWWAAESGESPPSRLLPRLVERTGLSVRWLVTGAGPRYLGRAAAPPPRRRRVAASS